MSINVRQFNKNTKPLEKAFLCLLSTHAAYFFQGFPALENFKVKGLK